MWTLPSGGVGVLVGDVSGKGLEVAAASAMVRFFVEARTLDSESPAEVLAQTNAILRARLPAAASCPPSWPSSRAGALRWCNAGHPPPRLLRAGGESEPLLGSGLPLGIEDDGLHEEREGSWSPATCSSPPPTGCWRRAARARFFGDERLPELLAEHGRTMPPQALAERMFAAAQEWAPVLHDDVVVLALRRAPEVELRDEPAGGPAAQALYAEYQALVRERLGPEFEPTEEIFATERAFDEERAGLVVLYARGRPVGCGGLRSLGPDWRDQAHVRHRGRARRGPRAAAARRARAARPPPGARRVRLLTTEVLTEARALYASAGYAEVEVIDVEGRRDVWLEKVLDR